MTIELSVVATYRSVAAWTRTFGTGKLTAILAQMGADVTAVEPDQAMLATLRSDLPGATALSGSAESIPLPDAMPDEERAATLARIRRYLATRPETSAGEFTLPMMTCVLRVRRPTNSR